MGTNGKGNGLLEIHFELMELRHVESELKSQLHQVAEKRGALEQTLKSWPGAPAAKARRAVRVSRTAKAAARAERKVAKRSKVKGGGAPSAVLSLLQAHRGEAITTKGIKEQLPNVAPASVHNALSVLKKRGKAKSAGAGKWAAVG